MASIAYLLNGDGQQENESSPSSKLSEATTLASTREPLNQIQNNVQLPSITTPTFLAPAFIDSIASAREDRVRKLLLQVCRDVPAAKDIVQHEILVQKRDVPELHDDSDNERDGGNESQRKRGVNASSKRKAASLDDWKLCPRFATCENCEEEFDVTKNNKGDCRCHPGDKEFYDDNNFWADHDEDCHGDIEDLIDEPDFQGGFKWDCCDQLGDAPGCQSLRHKALEWTKRTRLI